MKSESVKKPRPRMYPGFGTRKSTGRVKVRMVAQRVMTARIVHPLRLRCLAMFPVKECLIDGSPSVDLTKRRFAWKSGFVGLGCGFFCGVR